MKPNTMFSHYRPLEQSRNSDDDDPLLEKLSKTDFETRIASSQRKPSWYLLVLISVTASICSALLGAAATVTWERYRTDAYCTSVVSHKSPITESIDVSYRTVTFEGSFLNENIYRQKGSPEVDAAWEALGVDFPEDQAIRAGIAPDQVKIASKYGGGFPANVEGLHHLHCLNLVRKGLWFNYEYYHDLGEGAFLNQDHIVRKHVTHCLDIIRQQLMCVVDVGVLGQVWWQNETMDRAEPFVDFNTKHTCRNYEDIRRWAEAHQLPESVPDDFIDQPKKGDHVLDGIP